MMFGKLDPLLNSSLRLAIISILSQLKSADFNYLKKETESSSGNLSIQIKKLQEAGYIKVDKSFENNYPKTTCSILPKGTEAFNIYVQEMKKYLNL